MGDAVFRLRAGLRAAAPAVAFLGGVILLAVPLRLFQGFVPTPILPMLVVFLYALYDPEGLPTPVIFAGGLLQDLLFGAAIGPWASVYLLVAYLVTTQRTYFLGRARDVVWIGFAVAATCGMVLLWAEMSLLSRAWQPVLPAAYQLLVTVILYPACAWVFFWLRARQGVREEWQV